MKKRLIPATIAALAISLTSVVAPSANAQTTVTIDAEQTIDYSLPQLIAATDWEEDAPVASTITDVEFVAAEPGASNGISYNFGTKQIETTVADTADTYELTVTATTNVGNTPGEATGTLTVTIRGAELTGTANVLDASAESQDTGLTLVDRGSTAATVTAVDAAGDDITHTVLPDRRILVTPGTGATGPITLTVEDDSLGEDVVTTIALRVTANTDNQVVAVRANGEVQETGIVLSQVTDETEVSATDEDGNSVPAELSATDEIVLTPATTIDGPITVTVTDPTLGTDSLEFTVSVADHAPGVDDNDSDVAELSIGGTANDVFATGAKQDTGLTVNNASGAVEAVTNQDDITAAVEGNKIFVTPAEGSEGAVTITVTDEDGNDDAETITVKAPESDEGSSIDGSSGGAIGIAIAAVVAAIAAFLGGVATGIIQLPPAIANLLPF